MKDLIMIQLHDFSGYRDLGYYGFRTIFRKKDDGSWLVRHETTYMSGECYWDPCPREEITTDEVIKRLLDFVAQSKDCAMEHKDSYAAVHLVYLDGSRRRYLLNGESKGDQK